MKRKRVVVSVLAALVIGVGFSVTAVIASKSNDEFDQVISLSEAGAKIGSDVGELRDAPVDSSLDFASVRTSGLSYFMEANGVPAGRGAEELLDVRVATGLYSGTHMGNGDWVYSDKPVWVVAVHNLPFSIPCGTNPVCEAPPGRFTVVMDANTGEVISGETWGGGPRSREWQGLDLSPSGETVIDTPTPAPAP